MFHLVWHWLLHRLHWLCLALVLIPSVAHAVPWCSDSSECRFKQQKTTVEVQQPVAAYTPTPPVPPVAESNDSDGSGVLIVAAIAAGTVLGLSRTRHYI